MSTTAERLAVLETMVSDIHKSVVADGQHTLVARVAVSEAEIANLKGWRHRTLAGVGQTLLTALVTIATASLGIHLPGRSL